MPDIAQVVVDVKQKQAVNNLDRIQKKLSSIGKTAEDVGKTIFAVWGASKFINLLNTVGNAAKDLQTTMQRFDSVFTKFNSNANKGVKELIQNFHETQRSAKKLISLIGSRLSMEIDFSKRGEMSKELSKLSQNLSVTYGIDVQLVGQKLTQGLAGMTRGLRDLGILIDTTSPKFKRAVQQLQLSQGISEEAAKSQAIYNQVLKQTAKYSNAFQGQVHSLPQMLGDIVNTFKSDFLPKLGQILATALAPILIAINKILQSPILSWLGATAAAIAILAGIFLTLITAVSKVAVFLKLFKGNIDTLVKSFINSTIGVSKYTKAIAAEILTRQKLIATVKSQLRAEAAELAFKRKNDKLVRGGEAVSFVRNNASGAALANLVSAIPTFLTKAVGFISKAILTIWPAIIAIFKGLLIAGVAILGIEVGRFIFKAFTSALDLDFWRRVCNQWLPAAWEAIKEFGSAIWNYLVYGTFKSDKSAKKQGQTNVKSAQSNYNEVKNLKEDYLNSITGISYHDAMTKASQNYMNRQKEVTKYENEYISKLNTSKAILSNPNSTLPQFELAAKLAKEAAEASEKLKDAQKSALQSLKQFSKFRVAEFYQGERYLESHSTVDQMAGKYQGVAGSLKKQTELIAKSFNVHDMLYGKNSNFLSVQDRQKLLQTKEKIQIDIFRQQIKRVNMLKKTLQETFNWLFDKISKFTEFRAKGTDAIDMTTMQGYKYSDSAYGDLSQFQGALDQINNETLNLDNLRNKYLNDIHIELHKIHTEMSNAGTTNITVKN